MKKLFISVLAIASLVACNTEEVLVQQGNPAIGFESIVDNATRAEDPSITADDLTGFNVWAFMDEAAGVVFNAEDVEKGANGYTYTNIQYWIPGHDYYFAALAPMDSANWTVDTTGADENGLGKVTFTNVAGTEDLLYAAKTVSTQNMAAGQDMEKVKFQFNHLLSKVNFTFTNGFSNGIYSFVVKNVQMKAPAKGSIDLAVENWWDNDDWNITGEKVTLDFGDVVQLYADSQKGAISATAAAERLTIPADADYSYEITFTIDLYVSGVLAGTYNKTANVNGVALEMGKAYNFTTTISQDNVAENGEALKPIEFDVEGVNEWVNAGADVDYVTSTKVATPAELKAAIEAGVNVTLTADINLDETRAAAAGLVLNKDVVIDGNGFALSTSAVRAIQIIDAKNVTVKNLTLNAGGERGIQLQGEGQTLVVENVKAVSANRTLNVTATAENCNVHVSNSEFTGLTPINVWGANHNVTLDNVVVTCADNTDAENYAAIYNAAENTTIVVNGGKVIVSGDSYTYGIFEDTAAVVFNGTEGNLENCVNHAFAIYYGVDRYTFPTIEKAYEAAQDGDIIVLCQNVQIDAPLHVSKNIVFNLNGKNISIDREGVEKQDYVFAVFEGGKLTINGEGNVAAGEANTSVAVWAYGGDVVINGGNYTNAGEGCDLILADKGSVVEINGGTFKAVERKDGVDGTNEKYSALNCIDNSGSSFVVQGGRYFKFDPANNASENPAVNFVADGYKSVQDGDWFEVVAK